MREMYTYKIWDAVDNQYYGLNGKTEFLDFDEMIHECVYTVRTLSFDKIKDDKVYQHKTGKSLKMLVIAKHPLLARTFFREL